MEDAIKITVTLENDNAEAEGRRAGAQFARGFEQAQRGLDPAREAIKNVRESLKTFGDQARTLGTALTAAITAPLVAVGAAVLKIGVEYEATLNTLQAVTRASAAEMSRASQVAKQLGADITLPATSAADAAKAMTELAKGGFSIAQAMEAARGTLQLAAAAQIKEAEAAEITANALNAFKLEAREASRVADLLAAASNASSAEIGDFALALKQSSASAAALRIPIEETVTSLGLLANAGIKGSDAGTSLKTALTSLAAPTGKAAEAMKALGINAFDSQGKLLPLREVVSQFSAAFAQLSDQQRLQAANTIFGSDAMRAALIVFAGGVEQFDKLREAVGVQGAAAELAAAKTKGLGGAYAALKSQLETGAIIAFEKLKAPLESVVRFLADGAAKVIDFVEKLNATNPQLTTAGLIFAGIAAAVGPAVLAIAGLATAIGTLGAPLIAAIAAITVAAAGLSAAWSANFLGIRDITYKVAGEVSQFAREQLGVVVAFFRENLPIIKEAVANVLAAVRAFWKENGSEITTIVKETWAIIQTIISTAIKTVLDVIKLAAQLINADWSSAWETFKGIVSRAIDAVASILQSLENRIVAGFKLLGNVLVQAGAAIKGAVLAVGTNIVAGIIEGIKNRATDFYNTIKGLAVGGVRAVKDALGIQSPSRVFYGIGLNVGEGFIGGLEAKREAAQQAMKSLVSPATLPDVSIADPLSLLIPQSFGAENIKPPDFLLTLKADALETVPALDQVSEAVRQFGTTTEAVQRQVTPLENAFKNLFERFTGFASRGIDKITSKLGAFGGFAKDLLEGVTQDIFENLRVGLFGGQTRGGNGQFGARTGGLLGSLFGGIQAGTTGGNFSTPGFNSGGNILSDLFFRGSGGNSSGGIGQLLNENLFKLAAPPSISASGLPGLPSSATGGNTGFFSNLKNLFSTGQGGLLQGIGFGKSAGAATGALAQALPFLGLSFGAQLGGGGLGSILGGAGGALLGIGATAAPAFLSTGAFASGGALGGFGSAATALFSNPFTLAAGAALLVGGFLFGRARQRRKDEATSGDYLQDAVNAIFEIRDQVKNDQVQLTADQAKQLFRNDVLNPFIAQINTIKTKSVRESRLKNQTRDLENLFTKEVLPAIEEQAKRIKAGTFGGRDIKAEFAQGGIVPGRDRGIDEVLVLARPQEMYIPLEKQRAIQEMAGFNIFAAAGIPGAHQIGIPPATTGAAIQPMQTGGIVAPQFIPTGGSSEPITITIGSLELMVGEGEAAQIVARGVRSSTGRGVIVDAVKKERRFGAL